VNRRTRLVVKGTAVAIIVASLVGARSLSEGQAALFFTFAVASLILFVVVLFDFDTWVESVPPVPKGTVRGWVARGTRRVRRAVGWVFALCTGVLTWLLSVLGYALVWALARMGQGLTHLWVGIVRGGSWVLVRYRAVAGWFWSTIGQGLAWALVRTGEGFTHLWVGIVRGGSWVLVRYRAVAGWFWSTIGHGLAWALVRAGEGLTYLWIGVVHGGFWVLVRYRAGAGRVWSWAGRALAHLGAMLTVSWNRIARAGAWSLDRCRAGIRWAWLAIVGRGDEPTPKPVRRWYTATFDAAFGIPPDDAKVDVFGGRVAPPHRDGETVGAPAGRRPTGTGDDPAL
jgi:hypothetical protein